MDQQALRELEACCVQEEPPFCSAACPLRVDVRTFMAALAKGDVRGARRVLDRHMPFPAIVGRLCEAPCQYACKRQEVDMSLAIGLLERFCVSASTQVLKAPKMPAKNSRVAVLGGGLFGMTAALDLSRKGHEVHLFSAEEELGAQLGEKFRCRLPADTFSQAATTLRDYGAHLHLQVSHTREELATLAATCDALCLDGNEFDKARLPFPIHGPDPITLALNNSGCFGGGTPDGPDYQVIKEVELGRRAALSVERFLQKVSLTAEREREGSIKTRLFTSLEGIKPQTMVMPTGDAYSADEARKEALRCIQCECMECVKQCTFLQQFKEYPKTLVRRIYNNLSIVQGTRNANTMINSCSLCGQCTVICPLDFPVHTLCQHARQQMVQSGHMPPSAHDFALTEMQYALGEACSLVRHQPGTQKSRYLYFPGCQLSGSAPQQVASTYSFLMEQVEGGVGLFLSCCGIPARWAGDEKGFAAIIASLAKTLDEMGKPTLICACTSCLSLLQSQLPDYASTSVWEILAGLDTLPQNAIKPEQPLTLHDPCGARENSALRASVRKICQRLGFPLAETTMSGELTDCCGYGGLMQFANQTLGDRVARVKVERSEHAALAYCAMCRDNMAAVGKPSAHLLEYLFPDNRGEREGGPLSRPNPGFSLRHENRSRIKEQLMHSLWQEEAGSQPAHTRLHLHIAPELVSLLEKRHILVEDVQKVIHHAETSGSFLSDPENGRRLAYYKPVRVTYWVEYENGPGESYTVHNSYSHRMVLPEKQS